MRTGVNIRSDFDTTKDRVSSATNVSGPSERDAKTPSPLVTQAGKSVSNACSTDEAGSGSCAALII